jgi:hypothetical protein
MVDIRSIAGSSHPSRHGQWSKQEATSCSRVGRSRRTNARDATTTVVAIAATAHRQHSAATTAMTPPGASPEATVQATRQLLHNPLAPHASPSAAEQWRHDVDQLVVAALNTSSRGGRRANHAGGAPVLLAVHLCSPMALHASSVPHTQQYNSLPWT